MPLNELLSGSNPARDDVQQTDLGYDVVSRYICNNWQEIVAAQGAGAYPFDVVVIGAGMFGGILLLPQYLQIVHGSSPTVAGLQMIPLVAGIMTGAMSSGVAISKTGKYKIYPLVGIVFIVVALVSMSFIIDADTSVLEEIVAGLAARTS